MSLLEILQLIGYSMAATLPLWLGAMLLQRRHTLSRRERVLLALAFGMGAWHTGNLFITLHAILGLTEGRWNFLLRLADTVAVTSITLTYSFLLHVHLHLWADARGRTLTRTEQVRVYLSYIPALFLCIVVPLLWMGPYEPMFVKMSRFVWPFALWATYVLSLSAATDLLIARRAPTQSERWLMQTLAASFLGIAVLILGVYAFGWGRGTTFGLYLQTLANLGSLLPTGLLAYHIYRYRYLELIVRESLIVASFAAVILVVYLYGIRTFGEWMTARYQLRVGAVDTLLILSLALVAAPLRRWFDRRFRRLFEREAALYRDVVTRIGAQAGSYRDLPELLGFVEERITTGLNLRRVHLMTPRVVKDAPAHDRDDGETRVHPATLWEENRKKFVAATGVTDTKREKEKEGERIEERGKEREYVRESVAPPGAKERERAVEDNGADAEDERDASERAAWAGEVLEQLRAQDWEPLEGAALLRARGFELAYALCRESRVVGLMLVDATPDTLTHDVRAVLEILAGQVAIAIEDCRLVEENVRLERRLAQGERLAALGQMAATVAHEVKNPLSAIKSIAQVMREDTQLDGEYTRDLDLIVGETDRLNRSVTQLLNFARTSPPADAPQRAAEVVRTTVALLRAEANGRGVILERRGGEDAEEQLELDGAQAAALRDALSNLLLNALQATPTGGRVTVESHVETEAYLIAVEDSGGGVPAAIRERIWEPFFTTKQRGTGLGLAIVRKRMEEVGGSTRLASKQPAQGARFELRLPLSKKGLSR
ncbi:MAG TPA: ATP-binding protein [Pyrinomonadaceae bacterium]|jgi:signal transduction histidine kinase|nr:ATP-binding protein [Pyrinomonadaceae bacterium]